MFQRMFLLKEVLMSFLILLWCTSQRSCIKLPRFDSDLDQVRNISLKFYFLRLHEFGLNSYF